MLTDRQLALAAEWLLPDWELPWQWDADGEAIHWLSGTTVVFREELRLIVERNADRGLPPAAPLLLLLAGCRGKMPALGEIASCEFFSSPQTVQLPEIFGHLKRLTDLPAEIIGGIAGRAALVRHVFAEVPPVRDEQTAAVLAFFREELPIKALPMPDHGGRGHSLRTSLFVLETPLAKIDANTLALLRQTGVDTLPEAAEIDLPETPNLGRLFSEMEDDPELSPILRVTRNVMVAVSLPQALAQPDEEMLGGVSDIGNRGPLHRLLLSELAHDDDTLAIRVALNEALYLRREPAAQQPPGTLALLLDSGVRMWGTPRVFAISTALAFLAKAPPHAAPAVFRATRTGVAPVELRTRAGLVKQLGALESTLHAGASLAPFATALAGAEGRLDVVIVTHAATAEDRTFLDALAHLPDANIFLAALDREGRLAVRMRTAHGWRTLAEARIDLGALAAPRPRARQTPGSWPAILDMQFFPFFLSLPGGIERRAGLDDGVRAFLNESREVWLFSSGKWGGRRVAIGPCRGSILFFGRDQTRDQLGVVTWRSNEATLELRCVDSPTECGVTAQRRDVRVSPAQVELRDGVLFLAFSGHAEAVRIDTGARLGSLALPSGTRKLGGRYFALPQPGRTWDVAALAWNGHALELHTLTFVRGWIRRLNLTLVFDRKGHETPWALDDSGRLFQLDAPEKKSVLLAHAGPVREAVASRDGGRMMVTDFNGKHHVIEIGGRSTELRSRELAQTMIEQVPEPQRWSQRTRFTHAGLDPAGWVMLRAVKGYWTRIALISPAYVFQFQRLSDGDVRNHRAVTFKPFQTSPDSNVSLQLAEWEDGSRAFLDGRGMLHLQSADATVPEVTFVLAESSSIPAWSSDGHLVGPAYFLGGRPALGRAADIDAQVRRFVAHIL